MSSAHRQSPATYEIQVQGQLDQGWETCFSGLSFALTHPADRPPITTITGPVADQSALRGMLCRLWDLNLVLISVRRIKANGKEENANV